MFFLCIRRPPTCTPTETLFSYTTLFRHRNHEQTERTWLARIAAALLFATTRAAEAAVETLPAGVSLRGDWQEGAVLFGKAPVGSKVWFGDRQLKLTPAGDFVFGINRDAPDSAELREIGRAHV